MTVLDAGVTPTGVLTADREVLADAAIAAGLEVISASPGPRVIPPGRPRDDVLSAFTAVEVAAWYRRLARFIAARRPVALAPQGLLHWLDGGGRRLIFDAAHVRNLAIVRDRLSDEVRPVFLTERKAKLKGGERWGGIVPRIQGLLPHAQWDGTSPFTIHYEGPPVEVSLSVQAKAFVGRADPDELDALMALHKFGLQTDVVMRAVRTDRPGRFTATFESWTTKAFDFYDFDPEKHFSVPNPDYRNPSGVPAPVAPDQQKLDVYHLNAIRVQDARLASPYPYESAPWTETDPELIGPAVVDATRSL